MAIILFPFIDYVTGKKSGFGFLFSVIVPLAIIYLAVLFLYKNIINDEKTAQFLLNKTSAIPFLGKMVFYHDLKRSIDAYRFLISGGIPIQEALNHCKKNALTSKLEKAYLMAAHAVEFGGTHTEGLRNSGAIPNDIMKRWDIGSISGKECEILDEISIELKRDIELMLDKLHVLTARTIHFIVTLFVAYKIYQNLSGHFEMINNTIDDLDK